MVDRPRIAIVGAGLGGLTAGIMLQRYGYEVTLYEQAPRFERLGAGINLGPNVSRIFMRLGLFERMAQLGVIPRQRQQRDGSTGEVIFSAPLDTYREKYGAPHLIMHRGDLQETLVAAVAPGTIELGKRLVDVAETSTSARLVFSDGTTAETDMIIGADGINSRLRELLLGSEPPIYSGEVAHRSIFPIELLEGMELPDHQILVLDEALGDDRHILFYFITHAREVMYFVTGVPQKEWGYEDYAPRPIDMGELREIFSDFHTDVRRVLEAAPSATVWPILERDPTPLWSRGRIVLLGDACHPMRPNMGQGAAMAMEDAVMLARCIDGFAGNDLPTIFQHYEAQRFARTSEVLMRSRGNWRGYGKNPEWLYGYDIMTAPLDTTLLPTGVGNGAAL